MTQPDNAFDSRATQWDELPRRVQLARDIAQAIRNALPLSSDMDAMDFGCGTGLLTLELQPFVRSIAGIDTSTGMLDVLREKVKALELPNVRPYLLDLSTDVSFAGSFHLIVSAMTLHHIQDLPSLLARFHSLLAPGGLLALADLNQDGGTFHDNSEGVWHNGFDPEALCETVRSAGFSDARTQPAAETQKTDEEGHIRRFGIFLLTAQKPV